MAHLNLTEIVEKMRIEWQRLDFEFVREQTEWLVRWPSELVALMQAQFRQWLCSPPVTLEGLARWALDLLHNVALDRHSASERQNDSPLQVRSSNDADENTHSLPPLVFT
jgi:hypothetical protein